MRESRACRRIVCLVFLSCCLGAILTHPCHGAVLFEETFDSQQDWNTAGALNHKACDTLSCANAPPNWNNYYAVPPVGNASIMIRSLPDGSANHGTRATGKALIAYYSNVKYSGGQELSKTFAQDYEELYVRVWIKTQSKWMTAHDSSIKLWRIGHWDRQGSAFAYFPEGDGAPLAGINWATNVTYRSTNGIPDGCYVTWARFDPQETAYYPAEKNPFWNDVPQRLLSGVRPDGAGGFADGQWHRYDVHVKMNTRTGDTWNRDGIYEFWYDGTLIRSEKTVNWRNSGSDSRVGWNTIQLGGNSDNQYAGDTPQWIAFDDIVVSTTPIPAGYVAGSDVKK